MSLLVAGVAVASPVSVAAATVSSGAAGVKAPAVSEAALGPEAARAAVASGKRVEILGDRTEFGQTWANPDGTLTTSVSPTPVRFQDVKGVWQDIDLTTTARPDGSYGAASAARSVVLPASGTGGITIPGPDGAVTLSHPGSVGSAAQASGSTVTYPNAVGGNRDLVEQLLVHGVEETVNLDSSLEGSSYQTSFAVPAGVTARSTGGGVAFVNAAGTVLGYFGSGEASDAVGAAIPVTAAVASQSGQTVSVKVSVAQAWLDDAARKFPVAVDPVYSWKTSQGGSNDSFIESGTGANTVYGTTADLRVGYGFGSGTDVARTLIQVALGSLIAKDMTVQSAALTVNNIQSSSCTAANVNVWGLTSGFNQTSTTWNSGAPTKDSSTTAAASFANGSSGCPAGTQDFDITSLARSWVVAPGNRQNYGVMLTGVEASGGQWKKFGSGEAGAATAPTLTINYDHRPSNATMLGTTPVSPCIQGSGRPYLSSKSPVLTAAVADADSTNSRARMEVWPTGGSGAVAYGYTAGGTPGVPRTWTVNTTLTEGSNYSWRVQGDDGFVTSSGWTPWCEFTVDTTAPTTPTVSSSTYPSGSWQSGNPSGSFTFTSPGSSDVKTWAYRFDTGNFVNVPGNVGTADSSTTLTIAPPSGRQTLHVIAIDRAGNRSPETTYSFGSAVAMTSPASGTVTRRFATLNSVTGPGSSQVWYAFRYGDNDTWNTLPASAVTDAGGNPITSIPVAASNTSTGSYSPTLTLDVAKMFDAGVGPQDGTIQLRADFFGGVYAGSSSPTAVTYDRFALGGDYATEDVGPGTVGLSTGNYAVSSTDVSVSSYGSDLTFSRTFNSTVPAKPGLLGPGWSTSLGVDAAASDYSGLTDVGGTVTVTEVDGTVIAFLKQGTHYLGQDSDSTLTLLPTNPGSYGPGSFTLTDADNNTTTFTATSGFSSAAGLYTPHAYLPTQVTQPGNAQTTSYTYDSGLPVRLLAPVPSGTSCPGWPSTFSGTGQMGCRALDLTYTSVNGRQQLLAATERTVDGSGNPVNIALACYGYNDNGTLFRQWDPRNTGTSCAQYPSAADLSSYYGYDGSGRLSTIVPVGGYLAATNIGYDAQGRVSTIGRTHNSSNGGGTETSTVVYDVPIGNDANASSGYHPDLSAGTAAGWAQTDLPGTAVAVYGPGYGVASGSGGDYRDATIHALDSTGREVNTGSYSGSGQAGWKVDTTEYDSQGNVVRTLTAANRDRALRRTDAPAGSVDLPADSAAASRMLDTENLYALNPYDTSPETGMQLDLTDTFEPMHLTVVPDSSLPQGTVLAARAHTHTDYDTGAESGHPAGNTSLHLETSSWTEASPSPGVFPGTSGPAGLDRRTTTTAYSLNGGSDATGWTFRTPLQTTETPGGSAAQIVKTTRLDPTTGIAVESRMPSDTGGTGVGTTTTTFYTSQNGGAPNTPGCVNSAWYMQVCRTGPKAQISPRPAGMPDLPVTSTGYDWDLRPTTVNQTVTAADGSSITRSSKTTYDNGGWADRPVSTATTGGVGTALPAVTISYDTNTGLPVKQDGGSSEGAITTRYDDFGRTVSYTDADGATALTAYDGYGRVSTSTETDSSGATVKTTSMGYDGAVAGGGQEHRHMVTSASTTGTGGTGGAFTGSYDPDGAQQAEVYPNGINAAWTHDETGDATALSYSKGGTGWFIDDQRSNIHGQWRTHDGLPSTQIFTYDGVGRLTQAQDTSITADTHDYDCQTRNYTFDVDSNRTGLTSYPNNGTDGSCQTSSGAVTVNSSYDAADRLTSSGRASGVVYDAFGRTTTLPAALATASGSGGSTVTNKYYSNDLVQQQSNSNNNRTWGLDPTQQRLRNLANGSSVQTSHYDGGGDSPSWLQDVPNDEGTGSRTFYTSGLDGNLAVSIFLPDGGSSSLVYDLTNLHGDLVTTATASASTYDGPVNDTDEYGNAKSPIGTGRYGWLGGKQRSNETLGNLTLMGVRLYSPVLGRFLQTDPIKGGNANPYDYCTADPTNCTDLDGRFGFKKWLKRAAHAAQFIPGPIGTAVNVAWGGYYAATGQYGKAAMTFAGAASFGVTRYSSLVGRVAQRSSLIGKSSKLFGRGKIGAFNRNDVARLGWSWKGGAHDGANVFRAVIGSKRNRFGIHLHYTMMRGVD